MRRQLAFVLAAWMALLQPLTILDAYGAQFSVPAATGSNLNHSIPVASPSDGQESKKENVTTATSANGDEKETPLGTVIVEIHTVLPLQENIDFDVKFNGPQLSRKERSRDDVEVVEESVWLSVEAGDGSDTAKGRYVFDELFEGRYELIITADGYLPYRQTIDVKGDTSKIMLLNDLDEERYDYNSSAHPGRIRMGDINGDEKINEKDLEDLVDAIQDGEANGIRNRGMDLNLDGDVDLADLQYFSISYGGKKGEYLSTIERSITVKEEDVNIASPGNAEEVEITGNAADLFDHNSEDSSVTLERKDGESISEENPVELTLDFENRPIKNAEGFVIQAPSGSENAISSGTIQVTVDAGNGKTEIEEAEIVYAGQAGMRRSARSNQAVIQPDGSIVVTLMNQRPVKKVTIKVTGTVSQGSLAEISQVEFLGDMADRIPPPVQNIPEGLEAEVGSAEFTVSWKKEVNVTGYEVAVSNGGKTEVLPAEENTITVNSFDGKKMLNYETYQVKVRSVNGSWKSAYSAPLDVVPQPSGPPDAPENVSVKGSYRSLQVSWKDMKDTLSYSLYYRQKSEADAGDFTAVEQIEGSSYTLTGLADNAPYELYLIGHNHLGDSKPSQMYSGKTTAAVAAKMPAYGVINDGPDEGQPATNHIVDVANGAGASYNGEEEIIDHKWAMMDGDPTTSWLAKDWDGGVHYPPNKGPVITLDNTYEMDTIRFIAGQKQTYDLSRIKVMAWADENETGNGTEIPGRFIKVASLDGNESIYYEFTANEPFKAQKLQLNLTTDNGNIRYMSIAEVRFYEYDSLIHDVNALFADDLHVTLKKDVTLEQVQDLIKRAEAIDPVSGETHPKKELALKELKVAESILINGVTQEVIQIDTSVSKSYDRHITFAGGLNAWQPLGVAALAGETVTIYVGAPGKTQGDKTSLKLFATQYHGESSAFQKDLGYLQAGINEILIPPVSNLDYEQGGALYVEYTGNNPKDSYAVRVSGGSHYPVLDVTKAKDENERNRLIAEYYAEMDAYVKTIEDLHNAEPDSETSHRHISGKKYDKYNCILGATDIVLDQMMYSVAIEPLYQELQRNGEPVKQLTDSLKAMDEMVNLYYQHKGLSKAPVIGEITYGKDKMPTSRLNIRYQRMFAGAFMYAGGLHIGIEWNSVPALGGSAPVKTDADGRYESGQYFGWGISHEIGHIINEGAYAYAEVTNNYYPQLAQSRDSNETMRFDYEDIYKKVTSGTKGGGGERLAMYWQLHMAYDNGGFNFKTYDNYADQMDNLIFARIDSYARDVSRAPAPKGVKLNIKGQDKDNSLMRLACAAAEKNLLEFFERWGLTPNEETVKYAEQFEKETRAIYYENDDSRVYRLNGGVSVADSVKVTASAQEPEVNSNQVILTMKAEGAGAADGMLGYEITRIERHYGQEVRRVVGFTTEDTFTDTIMTVNNRVAGYEVRGIDKCMNPTDTFRLSEEYKISHDGALDKTDWKITINAVAETDKPVVDGNEEDFSCSDSISSAGLMIDNDPSTVYKGTSSDGKQVMAVISLGKEETIAGIKYTYHGENPIRDYKICISDDGANWTDVKIGRFKLDENGTEVVYFDQPNDPRYNVYDTSYVRIIATGAKTFNAAEFDILAPTGDNIELDQIGKLAEDAVFENSGEDAGQTVIPKGSIVFTGTYKGNPAYNMMILYDEKGNVVGGVDADGYVNASMIIFAPNPVNGQLGEITSGTWIYYLEPEQLEHTTLPSRVRAELYRTDDIQNKGDRLVSDTLFKEIPKELPDITIKNEDSEAVD